MNVRDVIGFLTSRGFAIFLLAASVAVLALWANYPALYTPLLLVLPFLLLVSLITCTVKRVVDSSGRGCVRFWASVVFHLGLMLGVLVMLLSPLTRYSMRLTGIKDNIVEADDVGFVDVLETPSFGASPSFFSFRLNGYDVEYKDDMYPVDYLADISIGIMSGQEYAGYNGKLRINGPVRLRGYEFLLETGGYLPYFILREKEQVVLEGFVRLSTLTKMEDSFDVKDEGLTVRTRFFPDLFTEAGKVGTRSPVVRNPAYGIKIVRRDAPNDYLYAGVIKPGGKATFGDYTLELAEIRPFVAVLVVRDPMYYWFFAGWGVGLAGLVLRYMPDRALRRFTRKEGGPSGDA